MSEMIERVARAICAATSPGEPCENQCQACTRDARAAIAAMREPTRAMLRSGFTRRPEFDLGDDTFKRVWQGMVDGALNE